MARILIAVGNTVARNTLTAKFAARGHEVVSVATADEALEAIERRVPSAVLLGLGEREPDGQRFLSRLRDKGITIPLVLVNENGVIERATARPDALTPFHPAQERANGIQPTT